MSLCLCVVGVVISGPVASCHGGGNYLVPREGNVIGAGRMESDAKKNAQIDAVAKIIFWSYCSAAME